jgi:hypothetical protein
LLNTRDAHATRISAANVARLGVAWTMPLTAGSVYGTFAANPVTDDNGVVYLQDLASRTPLNAVLMARAARDRGRRRFA